MDLLYSLLGSVFAAGITAGVFVGSTKTKLRDLSERLGRIETCILGRSYVRQKEGR